MGFGSIEKIKGMATASKTNGKGISLEERFANVSGQLSCVTERLGRAEHDLDLERASREDIINAEVEIRLREREKALEAEYEEKRRRLDQEKKEHEECSVRERRGMMRNSGLHTPI